MHVACSEKTAQKQVVQRDVRPSNAALRTRGKCPPCRIHLRRKKTQGTIKTMAKNFKYTIVIIVALFAGATSINAQDSIAISKHEYDLLKKSNAASHKTDRSCLDWSFGLDTLTNCGGWMIKIGAGLSSLNWENNEGVTGTQNKIQYTASVGYRFIHYGWIAAFRPEATITVNPSTTVERLSNKTTIGIGGSLTAEFFPHEVVRLGIGAAVQTRNLTAYDSHKDQKYDGNVILYGPKVNINFPLFKIWSSGTYEGERITKGSQVYLDITGSYMFGTIHKEWTGDVNKVDFKEAAVTATLGVRF